MVKELRLAGIVEAAGERMDSGFITAYTLASRPANSKDRIGRWH